MSTKAAVLEPEEESAPSISPYQSYPKLKRSKFAVWVEERENIREKIKGLEVAKRALDDSIMGAMLASQTHAVKVGDLPVKIIESFVQVWNEQRLAEIALAHGIPLEKLMEAKEKKAKSPYVQTFPPRPKKEKKEE